jgi:hypothetical protein
MKLVHVFDLVSVLVAIGLAFAGQLGAAFAVLFVPEVVQLIGAMLTGKQTNDTER